MRRICYLWVVLLVYTQFAIAQIPSPEQFLGYKIGTRYTPHSRLVEYFKQVAMAAPNIVKLQQYGQTNEGRPLMVAFISTPANIANLENIRQNNLRLAYFPVNSKTATLNTPAIVWLSYNVHGNEPSSSEAAMLTLYALADSNNRQSKEWLKNLIVIIDPCLNPDGRDRYVNWYNSIVGKTYNPAPDAREHHEPWPAGRTNHYNFDLNRDWAWQTQIESQQRMKLFNDWLPQIHVDFHEQGYNAPYYFAPAAEPYHEVITPWQRSFQQMIGRNHAKYFDQKGWLYFTREEFDLFYPSYGDTYPIYNGGIGMTYEQGGIGAGLGVINNEGDTLTLSDRAQHHFTTGLSTIEIASQNADRLLQEYQNFYRNNTSNGTGNYKSYIIKYNTNDEERISSLLELLQKNKIQYGTGKAGPLRGYNYNTGKEETFSVASSDIVVPSVQPKSALLTVLFEPNAKLADSITYDITAWSLPYVYGVQTYATNARVDISNKISSINVNNPAADPYGYVVRWNGVQTVKLFSQLVQKGIKLRFNERPFVVGGQSFDRGAILILKTSNQHIANLWDTVRTLATNYNVQLTPVSTGFVEKGFDFGSTKVHSLKARKVALVTGESVSSNSAGEIWYLFDQVINYPVTLINANDLGRTDWSKYDVLILPDGNYRLLADKTSSDELKDWIRRGGDLIAMENAVVQLSKLDWAIKSKKEDDKSDSKDPYEDLRKYENRERDIVPNITPGSIYRVELDNSHPLAFGYPDYYYTLKQDNDIYNFMEDGWNVGIIKKEKQVAGFVGSKLRNRLQDGLLFGVQNIGRGTITYFADDVLFRQFWENGKLMFCNAVFLVGQ